MFHLEFLLKTCLGMIVLIPLFVFFHELGHAIPHILNGKKVTISLVSDISDIFEFTIGDLRVNISFLSLSSGYCSWDYTPTFKTLLLSLSLGPIFTFSILAVLYFIPSTSNPHIEFFVVFSKVFLSFQLIFTSIPIEYPSIVHKYVGKYSDGYQIYQTIFKDKNL